MASDLGSPILGAYAASKHAVKGFIDSLRIEMLGERAPVSITLIKPSGIGTPLAEHAANHMGVAARAPPPAYAPEVVARAILHAVQHPRREITVGGAGFLQVVAAAHSPRLSDRVSSLVPPLLRDPRRGARVRDNLEAVGDDGELRSRFESPRSFSLYTAAVLHPYLAAGLLALLGVGAMAATRTGYARR